MAQYDESVLLKAAQKFNHQADAITFWCALKFGLFGLIAGTAAVFALANTYMRDVPPIGVYGSILLVFITATLCGIWRGRILAFRLRVEAQRLLVLVRIERNTKQVSIPEAVSA